MAVDFSKIKSIFKFRKDGEGDGGKEGMLTTTTGFYEINLVPAVKLELIKKQKMRNLVLFVAAVASGASLGVIVVLGGIKATQDITMASQDGKISSKSTELNSIGSLTEILTVQDQLDKISKIEDKKKVLSRLFSFVSVLRPEKDKVDFSEMSISLSSLNLSVKGSANAEDTSKPDIDYRVLEEFKQRVKEVKFDYGRYVTKNNEDIPTRCINDAAGDGVSLEEDGNVYAWWRRNEAECLPDGLEDLDESERAGYSDILSEKKNENNKRKGADKLSDEMVEKLALDEFVKDLPNKRIWRTPQFDSWSKGEYETDVIRSEGVETDEDGNAVDGDHYVVATEKTVKDKDGNESVVRTWIELDDEGRIKRETKKDNNVYMKDNGEIGGIEHFESACITYSRDGDKWTSSNENCNLVENGIQITSSSNGRSGGTGELVLTFEGSLQFNEQAFLYNNKHVVGITPLGKNVTDSYVQSESLFADDVMECASNDQECLSNSKNSGGQ